MANTAPRMPAFLSLLPQPRPKRPGFAAALESLAPASPAAFAEPAPLEAQVPIDPPLPPATRAERRGDELEQLAAAIGMLRLQGEHLAERARADTLELAFQIARRIVEAELRVGPDAFFSLVRSALRRCGEARRVLIRVSPSDLPLLEDEGGRAALRSMTVARVDLVADTSLRPGDCVVESAEARVDGRIDSRMAELRRALEPDGEPVEESAP